MNRTIALAALALASALIANTPRLAEAAPGVKSVQAARVLNEHAALVRPLHRQIGNDTAAFLSDIEAVFSPQQIAAIKTLPQQLQQGIQNANARIQQLPSNQRQNSAVTLPIVIEEVSKTLGPALQQVGLTAAQEQQVNALYGAYLQSLEAALIQLADYRDATRAKLKAIFPRLKG